MHKYQMRFITCRGLAGSEECHGMPMTILEMNKVLAWWRKQGFEITNLKIWRYGKDYC